jgi:hypothetical protein
MSQREPEYAPPNLQVLLQEATKELMSWDTAMMPWATYMNDEKYIYQIGLRFC